MNSGWLAYEYTGFTNRDVLLGASLSIPLLVNDLMGLAGDGSRATHDLSGIPVEDRADATYELLTELCTQCDPGTLKRIGYGLPLALQQRFALSLGELLTARSEAPGWTRLREALERGDWIGQLQALWTAFETPSVWPLRMPRGAGEPGLAAAAAPRKFSQALRSAEQLAQSRDPLEREMASRKRRLDFAVIHPELRDTALVLGADVRVIPNGTHDNLVVTTRQREQIRDRLKMPAWQVANASFEHGLDAGRRAAMELLRRCGRPVTSLQVVVELRGLLPPEQVHDASGGLALALRILAEQSELPMQGWLPTGAIDPVTLRVEPMSPDDVARKREGMLVDGINHTLLTYCPDCPDQEGMSHLALLARPTVEEAANVLWDKRWKLWRRESRALALKALGLQEHWTEEGDAGALKVKGRPVIIDVPHAGRLLSDFDRVHPAVRFLGGPVHSGKTWIAKQLASAATAAGWNVAVFTPAGTRAPQIEGFRKAVEMGLQEDEQDRTLLILDDLEWDETLGDLDQELYQLAETHGISILAVVRSDDATDWHSDEGLTSVAGENRLFDFAERLLKHPAFGQRGKEIAELAGKIASYSGGDLWVLVRLGELAAEGKPFASTVEGYVAPTLDLLIASERHSAQALAALAYIGLDCPDWFAPAANRLESLGARERTTGRWVLPSRAVAIGVLKREVSVRTEVTRQLTRFVLAAMQRGDDEETTRALTRLAREAPEILATICKDDGEALTRWMNLVMRPSQLGRALDAVKEYLKPADGGRWAHRLLRQLNSQIQDMTARDLALCLDILQRHLFSLDREENGHKDWMTLMHGLQAGVAGALQRAAGDSVARRDLLRALWRVHEERAYAAIGANADNFLSFEAPFRTVDFRLALEFREISSKLQMPKPFASLTGVKALEEATLTEATVDTYVSQLVLRERVERRNWYEVFPQATRALPPIIARSSARQLAEAVSLLNDFDRAMAVGLFSYDKNKLGLVLATRFGRLESANEMADLLDRCSSTHAQTARRMLYEDSGSSAGPADTRIRQTSLQTAARTIIGRDDAKGAGRLIKAALKVDQTFASSNDGFARRLAERLGLEFFVTQFRWEARTSVLFHLLEGLVAVESSYVERVVGDALDAIQRQLSQSMRPWAPRLALLLAGDPNVGTQVAEELSTRLTPKRLLECMKECRSLDALASFHHLGALVYQETLPAQFSAQFLEAPEAIFEALLSAHRPEVTIRAATAIRHTLRRGGETDSGRKVLAGLRRDWSRWLLLARTDGDLSEAIRGLTRLDSYTAENAARGAERPLRTRAEDALRRQPQVGAELLDAADNASPGLGVQIVGKLAASPAWTGVMRQIVHMQDPREQATTFLMLGELGAMPAKKEQNDVFFGWSREIRGITTPPGLVTLLRMFAAWDPAMASTIASRVAVDRLAIRMRGGARHDLEWLDSLLAALAGLGREDAIAPLLDALAASEPEGVVRVLGLEKTARLLLTLSDFRPDLGQRLAIAAVEGAQRRARSRFVLDDTSLLWGLGWLAYALRSYGLELDLGDQAPWVYRVPQDPATMVWSCGWLKRHAWSEALLAVATKSLRSAEMSTGGRVAALVVAADRDWSWQLLSAPLAPLQGRTSQHFLDTLVAAAAQKPDLLALLPDASKKKLIDAPHLRLHPARARLLRKLANLPAPTLGQGR